MVLLPEEVVKKAVRKNLIEIQAYEVDKFFIKFIKYIKNREEGKIEEELNNYFKELGLKVKYNTVELSDLEKKIDEIDESLPRHTTHFFEYFHKITAKYLDGEDLEKHNDDSVIKLVYFPIIDYAGDSRKRFGHYDYIVVSSFVEGEVVTTAHEVGHELGLSHVSNPQDIMFGHPFTENEILGYINLNLSARENSNLKFRKGSKKQWEKIKKQFQQKP